MPKGDNHLDISVYINGNLVPFKEALSAVLYDIDSNFSKLINDLLPSALTAAKRVRDSGRYHDQYIWTVRAKVKSKYLKRKGIKKCS